LIAQEDELAATWEQGTSELQLRRWRVLVIASVGVFMATLDSSIVAVALPVIGPHLLLSYSEALWVQAAYVLVVTVFVIPAGRLADRHGPLRLYTLGVLLFGLFSVMAGLSPTGLFLIMARSVQGVGGALLMATSAAIVTIAFPPEERGRALGLNVMVATIGLTLGPPLGGLIVTHLGWIWIFLLNAPVAAATLIAGWDLLGAERRDRACECERAGTGMASGRIDIWGAALLGTMLTALFVPLTFSPLWGWANGRTIGLLATAVVLAGLFIFVEGQVADPVLDPHLFRHNRVFAAASAAGLFSGAATYGVTIFTAVFLEVVQRRSAQQAGLVLLIQPAFTAAVAPFAGRLSDRVGSHRPAAAGLGLVAAGLGQLAVVSASVSLWQVLAALATVGLGTAFFLAPNLSAVTGSVARSEVSVASGVRFTMGFCGQGLSIAMLGAIAASKLGPAGGRVILLGQSAGASGVQPFIAGYREAMLAGATLALVGALISLAGKRGPATSEEHSPAPDLDGAIL
jgi:EmrB/QacA subfamily drug resistance transporter